MDSGPPFSGLNGLPLANVGGWPGPPLGQPPPGWAPLMRPPPTLLTPFPPPPFGINGYPMVHPLIPNPQQFPLGGIPPPRLYLPLGSLPPLPSPASSPPNTRLQVDQDDDEPPSPRLSTFGENSSSHSELPSPMPRRTSRSGRAVSASTRSVPGASDGRSAEHANLIDSLPVRPSRTILDSAPGSPFGTASVDSASPGAAPLQSVNKSGGRRGRNYNRATNEASQPHTRPGSGASRPGDADSSHGRASSSATARRRGGSARERYGNFTKSPTAAAYGGMGPVMLNDADNIKVVVRVRPLSQLEISRGDGCAVSIADEARQVTLSMPPPPPPSFASSPKSSSSFHAPSVQSITRTFPFHACLGPEVGQAEVMQRCGVIQLLNAALDGYNATILAYGQTGSGKTYTLSGRERDGGRSRMHGPDDGLFEDWDAHSASSGSDGDDDGIMARSLAHIFSQVDARNAALEQSQAPLMPASSEPTDGLPKANDVASNVVFSDGCRYTVRASYCEIYNEAIYDLLNFDQRQLGLRWDPTRGFHAPDLTVEVCRGLMDAHGVVSRGLKHRRVGSHNLNIESSRSHAVFTVHVEATPVNPEAIDYGTTRMGKVVFVDLAGSERLKDSQSEGAAMRETAHINRSLFMLGKVISALAAGAKGAMVPYRESKLTKLLMDSLGGSAMSLMIACCSPSVVHAEETLSTLSYATRTKNIHNIPAIQVDPQQAALMALRREVRILRAENAQLREQLGVAAAQRAQGGDNEPSTPVAVGFGTSSPHGGSSSIAAALPAESVLVPVASPRQVADLAVKLGEAQCLVTLLSSENTRLASENERLRAGGLQVAGDYTGAIEEVEALRIKLATLEAQRDCSVPCGDSAQENGPQASHDTTETVASPGDTPVDRISSGEKREEGPPCCDRDTPASFIGGAVDSGKA